MPTVAVVGASVNRRKYGNRAVRAFAQQGYRVIPVNPHETMVEGLPAVPSLTDIHEPIDIVTIYVPPEIGIGLIDAVAAVRAKEVWLNPGAESDALVAKARSLGIEPIQACSIMGVGLAPEQF
jgi:predicted CoA-binding protein